MKLIMTNKLPDKVGYYWYCNFGEHTPVILEVTKEGNKFYAQDEEFCFEIKKQNLEKLAKENAKYELEMQDGHHYGEELWCYIPNPFLPDGKTQVEPSYY